MSKWLLIDGFNLAYRCFFALPELTRADGHPTGALHGWVKSIWRLQDQERPLRSIAFFDLGGAQDRLALLPEYKAQRKEMPEPLQKQVPLIKELTRLMGLVGIEVEGVESDDLLAAKACAVAKAGDEALIVSADKDFAQIVGERIRILLPPPPGNPKAGWRFMDTAGVVEKFGVEPRQIADYLALVGDTSDNIPGLYGVGPKTAAKWLLAHGSLESVIGAADRIEPERFRQMLVDEAGRLRTNRITTLNTDLPLPHEGDGSVNLPGLLSFFERMEMRGAYAEAQRRYEQRELF